MEITLKNVSFSYGKKEILKNINLSFLENRTYGIIGSSGAGKTSLALTITGLKSFVSGEIYYNGLRVTTKTKRKPSSLKKIGIVLQIPEEQFFEDTVRKEILFGIKYLRLSKENIDDRIKEVLELLDLNEDILEQDPFTLSDGEKRKVALASILILNTEVLILDEPTLGLDNDAKELLRKVIIKLKKKKTIIIISHDINFLHKVIDDVVVLKDGNVLASGGKYEVFKEEKMLSKNKISIPDMMEFINLVRKHHSFDDYDDMKELMKAVYRDVK